jgi:tetratricopeptide (TPR) repeat protein
MLKKSILVSSMALIACGSPHAEIVGAYKSGVLHQGSRRHAEALAEFDKAAALESKFPGVVRFSSDRYEMTRAQIYESRAKSYVELNRLDEALADLNRAISLNTTDTYDESRQGNRFFLRAQVHEKLGKRPEAIADCEQSLADKFAGSARKDRQAWLDSLKGR